MKALGPRPAGATAGSGPCDSQAVKQEADSMSKTGENQAKEGLVCKFWRVSQYGWRKFGRIHLSALVVLALFGLAYYLFFDPKPENFHWIFLERLAVAGTLLVTGSLWLRGLCAEWEESLPKRLDVIFLFGDDNEEKMVCRGAFLAHQADIRNWGQQIGSQMAKGDRKLAFDPNIQRKAAEVVHEDGQVFKRYQVSFKLTKLPKIFRDKPNLQKITWQYNSCDDCFKKTCRMQGEHGENIIDCEDLDKQGESGEQKGEGK